MMGQGPGGGGGGQVDAALFTSGNSNGDNVEYFDGLEDSLLLGAANPYEAGTSAMLAPLKVKEPFCSFFDNRSPQIQPDLQNCTWYRDVSTHRTHTAMTMTVQFACFSFVKMTHCEFDNVLFCISLEKTTVKKGAFFQKTKWKFQKRFLFNSPVFLDH